MNNKSLFNGSILAIIICLYLILFNNNTSIKSKSNFGLSKNLNDINKVFDISKQEFYKKKDDYLNSEIIQTSEIEINESYDNIDQDNTTEYSNNPETQNDITINYDNLENQNNISEYDNHSISNNDTINESPENQIYDTAHYYDQNTAYQVLELINQARTENGLNPLLWNESLEESAKTRAKEIVNTFDHTRPDGQSFVTTISTNYSTAGENIAAGQPSAQDVVTSWLNSKGHRENILNPKFNQIGVALYFDSNSEYLYHWVQIFTN